MLYPQNGDRIVAIDTVPSLHPMYTGFTVGWTAADRTVRKSGPHVRRRRRARTDGGCVPQFSDAFRYGRAVARRPPRSLQSLPVTPSHSLHAPGPRLYTRSHPSRRRRARSHAGRNPSRITYVGDRRQPAAASPILHPHRAARRRSALMKSYTART